MKEDVFIREFVRKFLNNIGFYHLNISRKLNIIYLEVSTIKPFVLELTENKLSILRSRLVNRLSSLFVRSKLNVEIVVTEIFNLDNNAAILADYLRQQLQKRVPFRKVMKSSFLKVKKEKIKGIKIQISGRLNGAEIARTEWVREGQLPLHTLQANIDYYSSNVLLI